MSDLDETETPPTNDADTQADAEPTTPAPDREQPGEAHGPEDGAHRALAAERKARRAAEATARDAAARVAQLEHAERLRTVADELDLTPEQAAFVQGDDEDSMRESAERLAAAFASADHVLRRRPQERLRVGSAPPDAGGDVDIRAAADRVMRRT